MNFLLGTPSISFNLDFFEWCVVIGVSLIMYGLYALYQSRKEVDLDHESVDESEVSKPI